MAVFGFVVAAGVREDSLELEKQHSPEPAGLTRANCESNPSWFAHYYKVATQYLSHMKGNSKV